MIHDGEEVTDKRVISNVITGLDNKEKLIVYANDPETYIEASTYDEGYRLVNNVVYLLDAGDIYLYEFIGENEQLTGIEEKSIRNAVFFQKVDSGMELPVPPELMPKKIPLKMSPIQRIKKVFDRFLFLQVHVPPPYFAEGSTYSLISCESDDQCSWPSTCNKNGICCSIRDDGGCEIPRNR